MEEYAIFIHEEIEKQRNKISYKLLKRKSNKLKELEKKYDELLLEIYRFMEKYMNEELNKN